MDETLLDNRHAQRFKDTIEIDNEVSSIESCVPAPSTISRSKSLRKRIGERIKDSPLIKEMFSPEGHQHVDKHHESSPQMLPQSAVIGMDWDSPLAKRQIKYNLLCNLLIPPTNEVHPFD
ncbi:hypothetical protein BGX33_005031 [Mortierella sp. NVP41]|nr:hypothetical protein BGX33_005031 [Mortierella sp. NVP41]